MFKFIGTFARRLSRKEQERRLAQGLTGSRLKPENSIEEYNLNKGFWKRLLRNRELGRQWAINSHLENEIDNNPNRDYITEIDFHDFLHTQIPSIPNIDDNPILRKNLEAEQILLASDSTFKPSIRLQDIVKQIKTNNPLLNIGNPSDPKYEVESLMEMINEKNGVGIDRFKSNSEPVKQEIFNDFIWDKLTSVINPLIEREVANLQRTDPYNASSKRDTAYKYRRKMQKKDRILRDVLSDLTVHSIYPKDLTERLNRYFKRQ